MNRLAAVRWLLLSCFLLASTARAENWPQWRGPSNDGISGEKGLATEWDAEKNVAWKLPLPGKGSSTPIVWGDRLFLTSADNKDIVLLCVNTATGKEIWKRKFSGGDKNWMRDEANNASPSPCTDGKHIWALSGTGDLACLDFDGREVWRCNLQERYGTFKQNWGGIHSSPLLAGDRLYLSLLHANGAWVIALDKADGKEIWKVERKSDATRESKESYASPVLGHNGSEAYLITHGGDYTIGHRLKDGSEIWRVGELNPKTKYNEFYRFVTTPAASKDLIVVPTAKRGVVVGVKPDAQGLVRPGSPYELWRKPSGTPDVSSPLIRDGLVYLSGESGTVTCLDAKSGKELYSERIHGARYRGSPVYAYGKVYFTARDGVVTVVKAGPRFQRLAENRLPEQISASPAVSGGKIYLRGFEALYAIGAETR